MGPAHDRQMTSITADSRIYPTRPYLAVSAAIFHAGRVLIVRRGAPPMQGVFTLPGGGAELGETVGEAVVRDVREEAGLAIEPVALGGYRQVIAVDGEGKIEGHFVILTFAARYLEGQIARNAELAEAAWLWPAEISGL